jgi:hypothetical protein
MPIAPFVQKLRGVANTLPFALEGGYADSGNGSLVDCVGTV